MADESTEITRLREELGASRRRIEQLKGELSETHARQVRLVHRSGELERQIQTYEESRTMFVATHLATLARALLPVGSRRRRAAAGTVLAVRGLWNRMRGRPPVPGTGAGRAFQARRGLQEYDAWLGRRTPTALDLETQRKTSVSWSVRPLISVCMPVFNPDPAWLEEAIESVQRQSYENWELCICDDGSDREGVAEILAATANRDGRIKLTRHDENEGISRATNSALGLAKGDFVAFLDDDDFIAPHVLHLVVKQLQSDATVDLFYCDEDILLPSGQRGEPFLKPGWSPAALLSMNYITHFVVARRSLVEELGGLRPELDGGQDHDLVLRLTEQTNSICHIPEVLYTWRQRPGSTSMTPDAKHWAFDASVNAVRGALERRGIDARVENGAFPGASRVHYALPRPHPHVEIVIPTRDRLDQLVPCLNSVRELTDYPDYSITILDNDSRDEETLEYLRDSGWTIVPAPGPFNYSAIMNRGFRETGSEYIVTLNNDTVVTSRDWVQELLEIGAQPGVGAVGCRLVFPDGRPQHEGIVIGCGVPAANLSFDNPSIRIDGLLRGVRDVSAVTGACCLIRRTAWESVGGFDEALGIAYNDVDFCLRLRAAGFRVLYTPHITLVHNESASRGPLHPAGDEQLLRERWKLNAVGRDLFFSPRLVLGQRGWQLSDDEPRW